MSIVDIHEYLAKKSLITFPQRAHGIMQSTSNQGHLTPSIVKYIPQCQWKRQHYESGLMKWRRKSILKGQNLIRLILYPLSSFLKRKMANDDQYKITREQIS